MFVDGHFFLLLSRSFLLMTGQILCSLWLPWLFLAEPKSDTSVDFYNVGNCPPRNWLSVHIKVNNSNGKKIQTVVVETMVVQLVASIPSWEEAFLQPRDRVEALIILIETLGLEQMKSWFLFNSLGPLVVLFRFYILLYVQFSEAQQY